MSKLDQVIADITYVRSCLKLLKTIQESGDCNICKKKRTCEYVPKLGELVRYNCPFYEGDDGDKVTGERGLRAKTTALNDAIQEVKEDYDKEYEVFSNGFSVPISKELSQKIDKVINDQKAKADAGKAEIRLVPMEIVWAIAWIRMYGNRKYGDPENWKTVEPERYRDALMRHLLAYISDPKSVDKESGYPHLWHAACNMAFLMHFDYGEEVLHDKQPQ